VPESRSNNRGLLVRVCPEILKRVCALIAEDIGRFGKGTELIIFTQFKGLVGIENLFRSVSETLDS
jgi:hypothetical protein